MRLTVVVVVVVSWWWWDVMVATHSFCESCRVICDLVTLIFMMLMFLRSRSVFLCQTETCESTHE
jgi:hypothetical protein